MRDVTAGCNCARFYHHWERHRMRIPTRGQEDVCLEDWQCGTKQGFPDDHEKRKCIVMMFTRKTTKPRDRQRRENCLPWRGRRTQKKRRNTLEGEAPPHSMRMQDAGSKLSGLRPD
jgi:hypothetical protein